MNDYTNESNSLENNTEVNNMINSTNTLTNNTEENSMNNSKNELITSPEEPKVSMMNLFDDIAISDEIISPHDWTLADCKKMLTVDNVIFRETQKSGEINVSVRLHGLTMLKINKNKTTMAIPNGSFTKEEVLERIKSCDEMINEAKDRHKASLKKAKTSRETTYKRKPKEERPEIEEDGQEDSQPSFSE